MSNKLSINDRIKGIENARGPVSNKEFSAYAQAVMETNIALMENIHALMAEISNSLGIISLYFERRGYDEKHISPEDLSDGEDANG